jgi:hypothetical protein
MVIMNKNHQLVAEQNEAEHETQDQCVTMLSALFRANSHVCKSPR